VPPTADVRLDPPAVEAAGTLPGVADGRLVDGAEDDGGHQQRRLVEHRACGPRGRRLLGHQGQVAHGQGAEATAAQAVVYQQNLAQQGCQNNACGNTNALPLAPGQATVQCRAVDTSVEVRSRTRR
jgi:hypothetical protein